MQISSDNQIFGSFSRGCTALCSYKENYVSNAKYSCALAVRVWGAVTRFTQPTGAAAVPASRRRTTRWFNDILLGWSFGTARA